jgi:Esterase/lipase
VTSVLDRAAPPPDLTLRYGPRPEHVVDLRLPPAVPDRAVPLIVLIHGGFWRPAYDRTHLGPMGHALAAAGYMVAVPEYRRAGMAEEGWTGTFSDIALAADQVAASPGRTAQIPRGHLGGPLGRRSPRAVGRGPARPAARVAMARSVPRHRCRSPWRAAPRCGSARSGTWAGARFAA